MLWSGDSDKSNRRAGRPQAGVQLSRSRKLARRRLLDAMCRPASAPRGPSSPYFVTNYHVCPHCKIATQGQRRHVAGGSPPKPFAYATRSTASSSQPNLASYAAGRRARRIIFVSPSRGRLAARSATNTQSRPAGFITAIFTITAMRPHGGPALTSIPCPSRSNFGGGRARPKSRDVVIAAHQGSRRWMRPRRGHVPASQSALLTRLSAGL